MGLYNVHLTYVDHPNVNMTSVKAGMWQDAVHNALKRYARWGMPLTAQYSIVGGDRLVSVGVEGTIEDHRLTAFDPE